MRKIYFKFVTISTLFASSLTTAQAQTLIDGSFENCSSYSALSASANDIQSTIFTPCGSTTNFFGLGQSFYSDGNQGTNYGTGSCYYISPTPSAGTRNIGFPANATLAVKLTSNLVPGNCYTITFDGLNSPGDDGSGSCATNTGSAAFQVGVSGSASSFGTSVGSSALLAPSQTYTYTAVSISFMAPAGANNYVTIRLADQANVESMLFLDNMAITTVSCTVLPITLIDFSATKNSNCATNLQWKTASEINSSHFEIQKSTNGREFLTIAKINSKNSSLGNQYQFADNTTTNETYYRLAMVDIDGSKKYSNVINVGSCKTNNINIYPNPTSDIININGITKGEFIQIINPLGQVMISKTANQNNEIINIEKLPRNIYHITIFNNKTGQKTNQKITKL